MMTKDIEGDIAACRAIAGEQSKRLRVKSMPRRQPSPQPSPQRRRGVSRSRMSWQARTPLRTEHIVSASDWPHAVDPSQVAEQTEPDERGGTGKGRQAHRRGV